MKHIAKFSEQSEIKIMGNTVPKGGLVGMQIIP